MALPFEIVEIKGKYNRGDCNYDLKVNGRSQNQPYYYDKETKRYHPDEKNDELLDLLFPLPCSALPPNLDLWGECHIPLGIFQLGSLFFYRRKNRLEVELYVCFRDEIELTWYRKQQLKILNKAALKNGFKKHPVWYKLSKDGYQSLELIYETGLDGKFKSVIVEILRLIKKSVAEAEQKMI